MALIFSAVCATSVFAAPVVDPNGPSSKFSGVVSIEFQSAAGSGFSSSYCSGVLVGAHTVLTAAHCAAGGAPGDTIVRFNSEPSGPTPVQVSQSIVNPAYNPAVLSGDFQILRLAQAAPTSARIYSLTSDPIPAGQQILTVGYGGSDTVKQVNQSVISAVNGTTWQSIGSGARDGDSGGPAFVQRNGELALVGNLSFILFDGVNDLFGGNFFGNVIPFLQAASQNEIQLAASPGGGSDPPPPPPPLVLMPPQLTVVGPNDPDCDVFCSGAETLSERFTAPADGVIAFDWRYVTQDFSSEFDPAGFFFVSGGGVRLTDDQGGIEQDGSFAIDIAAGEQFVFFVSSLDNAFGAAQLDIFNARFIAATATDGGAVPEPGTLALVGLALAGLCARRRRLRAR